jgi:hypothetical protein
MTTATKKKTTKKPAIVSSSVSLQTTSLIVIFSVSQWTARKHDKKVTDEVNTTHDADKDAGRYNKLLIAKKHIETIQRIAGKARVFHYENTLPWGDNSERLLPSKNYFQYITEMGKFKSEFEDSVGKFLVNYEGATNEARLRLGTMFNQSDYPSRVEVESKFGYKTTFLPVPDNDFRVTLSEAEVEKLRQSLNTEVTNRLTAAVSDTWTRIKDQLTKMKEKLKDNEAIFRDSLFGNLEELIELLPRLNVTNDINIAKICVEMKSLLADPELIRTNDSLRSQKAQDVEKVLSKFGSFFS